MSCGLNSRGRERRVSSAAAASSHSSSPSASAAGVALRWAETDGCCRSTGRDEQRQQDGQLGGAGGEGRGQEVRVLAEGPDQALQTGGARGGRAAALGTQSLSPQR